MILPQSVTKSGGNIILYKHGSDHTLHGSTYSAWVKYVISEHSTDETIAAIAESLMKLLSESTAHAELHIIMSINNSLVSQHLLLGKAKSSRCQDPTSNCETEQLKISSLTTTCNR